ncbi:endolytic transglycosylase MltG [Leifsonia sp. H3M29-4]|uniref:endolytic transglycosylase MltG n=1 Tax=Salinibacterium metalliresistens TaxID=3031321 RepID=UPI0023DC68B1|nr:endolytic transglycosylase MltG [Salinibacterium metalliresistens]MDF1479799.1 endolytic transglycosylase MltG [Salinibacterium metalliresistens]
MADEPSWEDIFLPKAEPTEPAAPAAPKGEPEYPPTQVYPAQPAAASPAEPEDPFAALFGGAAQPAVPAQAPQTPEQLPAAAPDAFAALLGTGETAPATPAQPESTAAAPDPFAGLFGTGETASAAVSAAAASDPAPGSPDDPFAGLFAGAAPVAAAATPSAGMTRRELRESESGRPRGGSSGRGGGKPPAKRNLLWLKITLPIVLVLGVVGGGAAYAWLNYNEQVRELLGIPLPTDYEGTGNGEEVIVTIVSGDIGSDVAAKLHEAGVTMTFDAVYDYLVENPDIGFFPGNWRLQKEMSAASAMAALQDTANKVTAQLLITEGTVLPNALEIIASTTGIPLEEVQAAAADPTKYGVPAQAPSLEGYLFPATYELDGTETAEGILQLMVTTMFEHLDSFGVPVEQRHEVLTKASIVQREAGFNPDDFFKVARVFQNRLDQGINLESDATVAYGTGRLDTVWTEPEERADASNPYNTYANPGLPVGPIGLPGDLAIEAVLSPAEGPWLFFVPINLATGETMFSETAEEHQGYVDQLLEWCDASAENATYCE